MLIDQGFPKLSGRLTNSQPASTGSENSDVLELPSIIVTVILDPKMKPLYSKAGNMALAIVLPW